MVAVTEDPVLSAGLSSASAQVSAGNAAGKIYEGLVSLDKMRSHEMKSDEMR